MLTVIDISSDPTVEATLAAAAFGDQPGRWPLPTARTPQQLWLRAIAAGGQGRYGNARSDLATLLRLAPTGRLASLAHSTQGSFWRQLGWHGLARGWDGRASTLAGDDPEAAADALIGLAADALGMGRLHASVALLCRAEPLAKEAAVHRQQVRHAWVAAELAMASGDGHTAVRHAETATELAASGGSRRHQAKSEVVLAAALCSAGNVEKARAVGDAALQTTAKLRLVPLRWAVACLLVDVGSATRTTQQLRDIRDACAEAVRHAGGAWSAG
ncbi:hypothetical protein [Mycobacterium kyorinense]|uniref:MalT-like TPR region domain-containing protein n=1 Tax=Mycobacterium kyorinense TaxID=487514 RepID=A0A1X1XML8_9MYCO|nr:hypothetical protein [Mycobacterium kyorinense]ORV99983.1 hypothetical protein AWC14_11490 [Mycobacterium kyorinense]